MNWTQLGKQKQQMLLLAAMAALGILLLMLGNGHTASSSAPQPTVAEPEEASGSMVHQLEEQLMASLTQIDGAGTVTVQLMTADQGRKVYAYNSQRTERTNEETADGQQQTSREVQEQNNLVQFAGAQEGEGLLEQEYLPEITGVLVVASGAKEPLMQEQLLEAVATLLQLPADRIMVMPGRER